MKNIIIQRNFNLINLASPYIIYADGKNIGEIKNGKTENFQIADDTKEIYFETQYFKSQKLDISKIKDNMIIRISPNLISKLGLACLLIYLSYQIISSFTDLNIRYINSLLFIGISLNLYSTTFGSNKHLSIRLLNK